MYTWRGDEMKRIQADWKQYNANSRNSDTGDCVVRSISLAYGKDYDETHKELLALARDMQVDKYKYLSVFRKYLNELGHKGEIKAENFYESNNTEPFTIEDFCKDNPHGTFILLNGKHPKGSDHLACVIDGHLYDSWDSSKQYVTRIWVIKQSVTEKVDVVDVSRLEYDVDEKINSFLLTQSKKMPYATFQYFSLHHKDNVDYGTSFMVVMKIDTKGDVRAYDGSYNKRFVVKCNPRKSYEDQIAPLLEKARVAVREWIYSYRKDIEDLRKMRTIKTHPDFRGSRMLLTKFPEWIIPLVLQARDNGSSEYYDRYEVFTEALPGDPRGAEHPEVSFYADTIPELRNNFEAYKENYYRFNYDY